MTKKFGVIVVGCGYIAQAEHIGGWLSIPDVQIVALVDPRADLLSVLSQRTGFPGFATLTEAMGAVHADAVHICTPPASHEELIERATAAGLHVLVEKPLALESAAAHRCVTHAQERGVLLMVGAPRSYDKDVAFAAETISSGRIGELRAVESLWRLSLPPVFEPLAPAPRMSQAQYAENGLKPTAATLLEESIHHLAVLRDWAGGEWTVTSVTHMGSLLHVTIAFGDVLALHTNTGGIIHDERLQAYGSDGFVTARPWSPHFPWRYGFSEVMSSHGEISTPALARTNPYWDQIRDFVATSRGDSPVKRPAFEAARDIELIEAITLAAVRDALV